MKCETYNTNLRFGSDYCGRCGGERSTDPLPKLINDHCDYSSGLLKAAGVSHQMIELHNYVYQQVWRHALKHEREMSQD